MDCTIDFCIELIESSTKFEKNNTELKPKYILYNIELFKFIISKCRGFKGSFGTGYPYYALDNLSGSLPIIKEQLRYNLELINLLEKSSTNIWECGKCLSENGKNMPDLKQICYQCKKVDKAMSPRKVINRLPDIDIWMICEDDKVNIAKLEITKELLLQSVNPSDINPIRTMKDIIEITKDLEEGVMPTKTLPIDIHIVKYSDLYSLIESVPSVITEAVEANAKPFLPIHPLSLRKRWQYDDEAYNFVLDFLFSFTPLDIDEELNSEIDKIRKEVITLFNVDDMKKILLSSSPDSVKRRFKTEEIEKCYEKRIGKWK